jgi:hypothetical protein
MEAIHVIQHQEVEWGCGGAFFLVTSHVEIRVIGAPIRQTVDQGRIAMIGEYDRPIAGEQGVKFAVGETMRVLAFSLEPHQVNDIDQTHLQLRKVLAQKR